MVMLDILWLTLVSAAVLIAALTILEEFSQIFF